MTIGVLVLAAGRAVRFGADKRLAALPDGRCVMDTTLANIHDSGLPYLVCLGEGDDELVHHLDELKIPMVALQSRHRGHGRYAGPGCRSFAGVEWGAGGSRGHALDCAHYLQGGGANGFQRALSSSPFMTAGGAIRWGSAANFTRSWRHSAVTLAPGNCWSGTLRRLPRCRWPMRPSIGISTCRQTCFRPLGGA